MQIVSNGHYNFGELKTIVGKIYEPRHIFSCKSINYLVILRPLAKYDFSRMFRTCNPATFLHFTANKVAAVKKCAKLFPAVVREHAWPREFVYICVCKIVALRESKALWGVTRSLKQMQLLKIKTFQMTGAKKLPKLTHLKLLLCMQNFGMARKKVI